MKRSFFLIANLCFLLMGSFGQVRQDKKLAKAIGEILSGQFMQKDPGCAVLVAKKGQIVYQGSFGSADLELDVPMKPEMIFRLGSITKQFTSIAILLLVEGGKISLKDSVQKFIKDFPSNNHKITIENLLTHTSGITDYTQLDIPDPFIRRKDFTPKEIIDLFKREPLEFQPGTKFKYSNSGYFLLGYIIELTTNKKYQHFIQENIIEPQGLTNTYYDDLSQVIPNRVKGYKIENEKYLNADYQSVTIPYSAGALVSNVQDLYKWHQALHNYKLIKKETLEKAFTPYKLKDGTSTNYGYGWFITEMNGSLSIQHGGNINGFRSNEIYFPKEDVFVATLFNSEGAPMEELSSKIAALSIGKITSDKGIELSEVILESYTGKYISPLDPKRPVIISKEGNRLYAAVPGEWKAELKALSDTIFDVKNIRPAGTVEFFKDSNEKAVKIIMTQSGRQYEFVRSL